MKQFKHISMLLAFAAVLSLIGCTKDRTMDGGGAISGEDDGRYFYVSAGIALPSTSSRSATDETVNGSYDKDADGADENDQTNSNENENGLPDWELGYDYENDVRSMILMITTTKDEYVAHTIVKGITQVPASPANFDFIVNGEIKHSDLEAAYAKEGGVFTGNYEVNIYVFCNYTAELLSQIKSLKLGDTNWKDFEGEIIESQSPAGHTPSISNTIWASRSFLMTNSRMFTTTFPETIEEWSNYADKSSPFKLTDEKGDQTKELEAIKVERVAARLDFRDGSYDEDDEDKGENTYRLYIELDDNDKKDEVQKPTEKLNLFNVKLTRMALVNMSKKYYYMRRVSDDGTGITVPADNTTTTTPTEPKGYEFLGYERLINDAQTGEDPKYRYNYVVDTDWKQKSDKGTTITPETAGTYFNFPLYADKLETNETNYRYARTGWYVDKISEVLEGRVDTWSGSTQIGTKQQYRIWRYVTENTIPGIDNQITVQSTGIIFKGVIKAGDDIDEWYIENAEEDENKQKDVRYVSVKVKNALNLTSEELKDYPNLYSYDNRLYAGIDDLIQGAIYEGEGSALYQTVDEILTHWYVTKDDKGAIAANSNFEYKSTAPTDKDKVHYLSIQDYNDIVHNSGDKETEAGKANCTIDFVKDGEIAKDKEGDFMACAPASGITIYEASDEEDGEGCGYYCYYFYWNRHNDNLKSGEMGPMEFATVRNNVYKLSVTSIGKLGHPRNTKNDPDPVDPKDPDEDPTNYLQVKVEVLPWVVRVNDITF